MFDICVTDEQYNYAKKLIDNYNFGMRGIGDGNKKEQLTGIIGQTVLSDVLKFERPDGNKGFDGGTDFIINGKTVDLKTMTRTTTVTNDYVNNLVGYQIEYPVEYYIFASLNIKKNPWILTICGYISKKLFLKKADFFEKGSTRYRRDGSTFKTFAPLYEIKNKLLLNLNSVDDIFKFIK